MTEEKKQFLKRGLPIISVDTKTKELVGNFKNAGRFGANRLLQSTITTFARRVIFAQALSQRRLSSIPSVAEIQSGLMSAATFDVEQFVVYRCVVGSRAHGPDESDTDRLGTRSPCSQFSRPPNCASRIVVRRRTRTLTCAPRMCCRSKGRARWQWI